MRSMSKRALVAAVTLGVVLGNPGNALADWYIIGGGSSDSIYGIDITSGKVTSQSSTSLPYSDTPSGNKFHITAGCSTGGLDAHAFGGCTGTAGVNVENNVVEISHDLENVFGGSSWYGAVRGNKVIVHSGTIGTIVNDTVNGGEISGNQVILLGGTIGNVTMAIFGTSSTSSNNSVNLGGYIGDGKVYTGDSWKANVTGSLSGANKGTKTGNAVNVFSAGNKVGGVNGFQLMNFYVPAGVTVSSDYMLTVNSNVDLSGMAVNVGVASASKLQVGDKVKLLATNGITGITNGQAAGKVAENDFQDFEVALYLSDSNKKLDGTITAHRNNESSKSPVETQAAGLTMLTAGADMLATAGFANAAAAVAAEPSAGGSAEGSSSGSSDGSGNSSASTMMPFAAMGGNKSKVKSGSYCDVRGWNINLGLAKEIANKQGKLLIGPVVEYGRGSYDSYLDNGYHGAGDTKYLGAGVMAKQTTQKGFYYEGSLRGGRISNDYHANDNNYDSDANYLALHLGAGKILQLDDSNTLDCYGKVFYTRQFSSDTTMYAGGVGKDLHFDAVDSYRMLLGGRFTHKFDAKNSAYAGLAWQHEFNGTARATLSGMSTPSPSVKGETGILELGWKVKPGKGNFETGLGFTGSIGKQKGVGLNASFQWSF